ncbi:hypothetical protein Zmor_008296 [Zophobas morio]|uniref:Odorant receptor n=1 Tax=Zophobas morio TaxID=2755281 RepID=A0AA38MMW7_9CUCU|nr:hypothetical protein Zmor_008296 [Zophobas morio]
MFSFNIFGKYFPTWKSVLTTVYRPALFVVCITGLFPTYNIIYGYLSAKFVVEALRDQIENIHNGYEKRQHLKFDEAFHKTVKERLLRCFKQCNRISLLGRELEKRSQNFLFPFKIGGIFMMISIVLYAFSLENFWTNPQVNRLCSLAICSFLTLAGLAAVGQATEDLTNGLFDALMMVPWYQWNESNKKMYQMLLISILKPFKIKYSENISLNYNFAVELLRSFFSAVTVIVQLQQSRT